MLSALLSVVVSSTPALAIPSDLTPPPYPSDGGVSSACDCEVSVDRLGAPTHRGLILNSQSGTYKTYALVEPGDVRNYEIVVSRTQTSGPGSRCEFRVWAEVGDGHSINPSHEVRDITPGLLQGRSHRLPLTLTAAADADASFDGGLGFTYRVRAAAWYDEPGGDAPEDEDPHTVVGDDIFAGYCRTNAPGSYDWNPNDDQTAWSDDKECIIPSGEIVYHEGYPGAALRHPADHPNTPTCAKDSHETHGHFRGRLEPNSADFSQRQVYEQVAPPDGNDGCVNLLRVHASSYQRKLLEKTLGRTISNDWRELDFSKVTPGPEAWIVDKVPTPEFLTGPSVPNNYWGAGIAAFDYMGRHSAVVRAIGWELARQNLTMASCSTSFKQTMVINCGSGAAQSPAIWVPYAEHTFLESIAAHRKSETNPNPATVNIASVKGESATRSMEYLAPQFGGCTDPMPTW